MATLTLQEWTPQTVHLEPEQAVALGKLHPELEVSWNGPDTWVVMSKGLVGAAHVAGIDVVLQPHLPTGRVLWLLGYALKSPLIEPDAALAKDRSLVEAFADMYLRALRSAIRRGLQMGYRTVDESLMTVRGRLRMADQARRHFGMVVPAEVTYDDYTTDTEANRVLKAALRRLARMPVRDVDLRRRIAAATAALVTVSDMRFDQGRLPSFSFTRLNEHYRTPLALATIVLRSGSVDVQTGSVTVPGLLFDMWRVFQDFLFEALRPHMPADLEWQAQAQLHLDEAATVELKPDLSLWASDDCLAVGDAKYKRTEHGELTDLYQLLAYCIAADLPSGMLIYAEGPSDGFVHRVRNGGPELEVIGIDLAASQVVIEEAVRRIALRLARMPLDIAA